MVLRGKIRLSSGDVADVMYLEPSDWVHIDHLLDRYEHQANVETIQHDLVGLYRFLEIILEDPIVDYYKEKIKEAVGGFPPDKSFRWSDLNVELPGPWRFGLLKLKAFEELVDQGLFVHRGAGWYRRREDQ